MEGRREEGDGLDSEPMDRDLVGLDASMTRQRARLPGRAWIAATQRFHGRHHGSQQDSLIDQQTSWAAQLRGPAGGEGILNYYFFSFWVQRNFFPQQVEER